MPLLFDKIPKVYHTYSSFSIDFDAVSNSLWLDFTDANGNDYPALTASALTSISSVAPMQDPRTLGYWRNHPNRWSAEILGRIQATDDRFDGADGSPPDGELSAGEVETLLAPGGNQPKVLEMQLLAVVFNLATRQINAETAIESRTADQLGLEDVRDAVIFAMDTLLLPVNSDSRDRYSAATRVLDEINSDQSEVY